MNFQIAVLEAEVCRITERGEMVQNQNMVDMAIFVVKLAEASKELAESQMVRKWLFVILKIVFFFKHVFLRELTNSCERTTLLLRQR